MRKNCKPFTLGVVTGSLCAMMLGAVLGMSSRQAEEPLYVTGHNLIEEKPGSPKTITYKAIGWRVSGDILIPVRKGQDGPYMLDQ